MKLWRGFPWRSRGHRLRSRRPARHEDREREGRATCVSLQPRPIGLFPISGIYERL